MPLAVIYQLVCFLTNIVLIRTSSDVKLRA
jgi:hypothetical protein